LKKIGYTQIDYVSAYNAKHYVTYPRDRQHIMAYEAGQNWNYEHKGKYAPCQPGMTAEQ
jgi:hypothetical protein